ncbi:endolytic transglycosylase MltG [Streptococcus phocae subsp. salmonis]
MALTDLKDNEQKQREKSFKAQILAELEQANQIRKQKEEELFQKQLEATEAAQKTAQLYEKYQRQESSEMPLEATIGDTIPTEEPKKVPNDDTPTRESHQSLSERTTPADSLEEPSQLHVKEGILVKKGVSKRQQADQVAKKISKVLILSILTVMLVVGLAGTVYVYSAINPVDKNSKEFVQVEIPAGSGNKLIGQILEKEGLIKNSTVFNFYTKFKNFTNFQSGYYNLQKNMSLEEISEALQEGGTAEPTKPVLGKILIPEGYTIKQIAHAVETNSKPKSKERKTPFTSKDFLKLVSNDAFIKKMVKKYPKLLADIPSKEVAVYQLEGYLFPATYNYYQETELEDLVDEMLATTDLTLSPYYDKIASLGKTVNEVLTLASLVEKEGSTDDDRRTIASVFYNRLSNGMALQSNIAVLYAMGKLGQKTTLAEDAAIDTTINSPYNIYTNTGLMPGPVDSAGLSAIEATLNPASTDYLYFVANVHTGEVYYAKTFEEHSANVEKYVNSQIQ